MSRRRLTKPTEADALGLQVWAVQLVTSTAKALQFERVIALQPEFFDTLAALQLFIEREHRQLTRKGIKQQLTLPTPAEFSEADYVRTLIEAGDIPPGTTVDQYRQAQLILTNALPRQNVG